MTGHLPRRSVLLAAPAAFTGCALESSYLGTSIPPGRPRLIYANGNEPDVLDPGTYAGGTEMRIINALFDGLTKFHPLTLEPMAALATHYKVTRDATRFTFYLRGHPNPRGVRFANTDDLPEEFSRGRKAPRTMFPPDGATESGSRPTISSIPGGASWTPEPARRTQAIFT